MKIATTTTAATTMSPTDITYCTSRVTADPPRKVGLGFNLRQQCYCNVTVTARAERGKQASRNIADCGAASATRSNVLVSINSVAEHSNTPVSKFIVISVAPATDVDTAVAEIRAATKA